MKLTSQTLLISTLTMLFSFVSVGQEIDENYFEIGQVENELVEEYEEAPLSLSDLEKSGGGGVIGQIRGIIAIGEKIYKIIEKGKPVVNLNWAPINVLPSGNRRQSVVRAWELENWKRPVVRKWKTTFKNLYGMKVVSFTYALVYSYGGQFNGKGAYLANVQIVPEEVEVAWGYNMDMEYKLVEVVNHGRKGNPNAGATLGLRYTIKTVLKSFEKNITFHVQGNGRSVKY